MSGYVGPNIVKGNLVLNLDAANLKSYPGSGNSWVDSGGSSISGTLINGPTFDPNNNGSIVFDGINDYISTNLTLPNVLTFQTIEIVFKVTSSSNYVTLFGSFKDNTPGSMGGIRAVAIASTNILDVYQCSLSGASGLTMYLDFNILNSILHLSIVRYSSLFAPGFYLSYTDAYLNGKFLKNSGQGSTSVFQQTPSPIYIGQTNTTSGNLFQGNIYSFRYYNRALSAAEIQQNFNATRGRYGI